MPTQRPLQKEEPGGHAQVPLVHEVPRGQMSPQTPQFALSEAVLVHTPEQFTWPGGQIEVQARLTQDAPGAQVMLHPPQFRGSLLRSTHEPFAHCCRGGGQIEVQTRLAQTWLGAQSTLQAPQWVGSLTRSTHRPLHEVLPGGQPVHMPLRHVWPLAHSELQLPQFRGSLCGSTHWPLQVMSGRPQVVLHTPPKQTSRGPQVKPQPPQLR